jgi:NAD(P)-dependent dehydrogenase (short-subunit alcohol dehydrogenase family)
MAETTISTRSRNPVALVTGGTAGIGLEACCLLASRGVDVILTSRTFEKGEWAVALVKERTAVAAAAAASTWGNDNKNTTRKNAVSVRFLVMDLEDLSSVQEAVAKELDIGGPEGWTVDYLLLNAGLFLYPSNRGIKYSSDGIEMTVAVNHVAGFFLAQLMLPVMEETASKRRSSAIPWGGGTPTITFVSSDLHNIHSVTGSAKNMKPTVMDGCVRFLSQRGPGGVDGSAGFSLPTTSPNHLAFNGAWSYKYSKLLNVLTAVGMHRRLLERGSTVQCNVMEPGFIPASELTRNVKTVLGKWGTRVLKWLLYQPYSPIRWLVTYALGQPIRTIEEGAWSECFALMDGQAGKYYRLDRVDEPSPLAEEPAVVDGFWKATADLLALKGFRVMLTD